MIPPRNTVLLAALVLPLLAFSDELTDDERAVWELEIAYWEYVKANDIPSYRSLWDERFVGWPSFSEMPLGKAHIHEWVTRLHDDPSETVDFELTLGSVRAHGEVVAAHYLVRYFKRSRKSGEKIGDDTVSRITHTWKKQGDTWKIVTGMSGSWIGETRN